MMRNLHDTISPGGRKSIGNWLAAVPPYRMRGSINVSAGRRVVQRCHCSALSDRKVQSPPEWQAPLPVRISQP